jgi:hypothetical protein
VHCVALAPDLGRGYVSVLDARSLKVIATLPLPGTFRALVAEPAGDFR